MEMVSETYINYLEELISEGIIIEKELDQAVSRILKLKFQLGLFANPYCNFYENSEDYMLKEETRLLSREAAEKSIVMLKNNDILPLSKKSKVLLTGPFIDSNDLIGEWAALTKKKDVVTIRDAFLNDESIDCLTNATDENIRLADVVIMALGEPGSEAGEGNSKTNIHLDDNQRMYFDEVYKLNQNIVLIVFAGRPLIMTHYHQLAKAIIYAYQPGLEAGNAIKRIVNGDVSPSGKITMSFPYHEGQIPIYYNHYSTGRPFDDKRPKYRYNTRYLDCQNEPLYPFGYGLSYGSFMYSNLKINKTILKKDEELIVEIKINNQSSYDADEIVQCYIEAKSFSVTRPVNELKKFKKVHFAAFETKIVSFELSINDFRSYNIDMNWTAEERDYIIKVGTNSSDLLEANLKVIDE